MKSKLIKSLGFAVLAFVLTANVFAILAFNPMFMPQPFFNMALIIGVIAGLFSFFEN